MALLAGLKACHPKGKTGFVVITDYEQARLYVRVLDKLLIGYVEERTTAVQLIFQRCMVGSSQI